MKKIFMLFVIAIFGVACQKEDSTKPATNNSQPTGNSLITSEITLGENNKFSFFNQIIADGQGSFFFSGQLNGLRIVGKIDTKGSIVWQRNLNFIDTSLRLFDGEGSLKNSLLIAGRTGNTNDATGRGVVALYNANGNLVSDISFAEHSLIFFNDVTVEATGFTDNSIKYIGIAIGGAGNNTNDVAPYYATFAINSQGILSKKFPIAERLAQYPQTRFGRFPTSYDPAGNYGGVGSGETGGGTGGGGSMSYMKIIMSKYLSYYQRNSSGLNIDVGVMKMDIDFEFLNSNTSSYSNFTQFTWRKQVNPQSTIYSNYIDDLVILGGDIYTIGRASTEDGKNAKPNDGYWASGQICKLNKDGNILYNRILTTSKNSDRFFSITFHQGVFYVCGEASTFTLNSGKNHFGYAWAAKIDPNSGNLLGSKTFGKDDSRAVFNSIVIENNRLFTVGYKGYQSDNKESKAWFAEIDHNGL